MHATTATKFMGDSNTLITLKFYTLVRGDEINLVGNELRRTLGGEHLLSVLCATLVEQRPKSKTE